MTTAILAVQGAFAEHAAMLDELGEPWFELRCLRNMSRHFDRLILPGGESTVQGRLLREEGMLSTIRALVEEGMPVLGTCAGLILLAERVIDEGGDDRSVRPETHLGTMRVTVERNAYGRQLASFHATDEFAGIGAVPMTFIRAPRIVEVRGGAVELARVNCDIVAARDGNQIGVAFHPELDNDTRIHEMFLALEKACDLSDLLAAAGLRGEVRVSLRQSYSVHLCQSLETPMDACEVQLTSGSSSFQELVDDMAKDSYWIRFFCRPCCPAPDLEGAIKMLDKLAAEASSNEAFDDGQKQRIIALIEESKAWYPNSGLCRH